MKINHRNEIDIALILIIIIYYIYISIFLMTIDLYFQDFFSKKKKIKKLSSFIFRRRCLQMSISLLSKLIY